MSKLFMFLYAIATFGFLHFVENTNEGRKKSIENRIIVLFIVETKGELINFHALDSFGTSEGAKI